MHERRTLIEGLGEITDADPGLAADFVLQQPHAPKKSAPKAPPMPDADQAPVPPPPARTSVKDLSPLLGLGRVPVGARIRTELAAALKRASLERQLRGIEPYSIQDILEEALEPWLQRNGYLD